MAGCVSSFVTISDSQDFVCLNEVVEFPERNLRYDVQLHTDILILLLIHKRAHTVHYTPF